MSERYDQVLGDARAWLAGVEPQLSPASEMLKRLATQERANRRRLWLALGLALLVIVAWVTSILGHPLDALTCTWVRPQDVVRYGVVHVTAFSAGAALMAWRRTSAQILVRAFWWASLLASSVGVWTEPGTLPLLMPVLCVASIAGLWLLGDRPFTLDVEDGQLPLARHRGLVLAMLVFGVADTENLLAAALNHEEPEVWRFAALLLASAAAMLVSMWGLFRLRGWGLVAVLVTNVVVAALALSGVLIYDRGFGLLFAFTAVVQLGLAAPLLRTLLHPTAPTRARNGFPWATRARILVLGVAFVTGMLGTYRSTHAEALASHCAED